MPPCDSVYLIPLRAYLVQHAHVSFVSHFPNATVGGHRADVTLPLRGKPVISPLRGKTETVCHIPPPVSSGDFVKLKFCARFGMWGRGVPYRRQEGGRPQGGATFSRRTARKGFHWKAGGPRPPGLPRPPGGGRGALARHAIGLCEANAAALCHLLVQSKCCRTMPFADAKPASLFLVRSTNPGTLPEVSEVPEVSAQAPVRRSGPCASPVNGLTPLPLPVQHHHRLEAGGAREHVE